MPREGDQYRITHEWQELVRERMTALGIKSLSKLAGIVGIGRTAMWQLMQPGAVQTGWMPEINEALGLDPPVNNVDPIEAEMLKHFRTLSDVDKGREVERLRRASEEVARKPASRTKS